MTRPRRYAFVTVDVFTERRFGGNPLAVVRDARGLSDAEMQAIAAEFNLSETTFVLPPDDPAHTARVRIFNPTAEMPFAGHPNVGTGFVLAAARGDRGRDRLLFEELAGVVEVVIERAPDGTASGATITAPQPLSVGAELPEDVVAACAGLSPEDVVVARHRPVSASTGNPFVIAEVKAEALSRATPDVAAFRRALEGRPFLAGRLSLHLYAPNGNHIRARMFSPLSGTFEDPATGSAAAPLGALLLSFTTQEAGAYEIVQGVEMGRPSRLRVTARREPRGIAATVGGSCVPVMSGEILS